MILQIFYTIKRKIQDMYWSIRYAIQRVYKGYDERDVFGFNDMFIERMVKILEEFKRDNIACWWKHDIKDISEPYSEEETDVIIETLLWHFKMSDEDFVYKLKFGKEYDYIVNLDKWHQCSIIAQQNKQRALNLFVTFFDDLWI